MSMEQGASQTSMRTNQRGSTQNSMGMDKDAFKPKNTLGWTPPNSPKASGTVSRNDLESDKSEDDTGGCKNGLNKTQEVESDTDEGEEQGNRDETRVQRLNSHKYKPFGARATSGPSQQDHTKCQVGPGKRKGTKKKCGYKVEEDDEGVLCDCCKFWFHKSCQKVTRAAYEALRNIKGLFWLCWECRDNLSNLALPANLSNQSIEKALLQRRLRGRKWRKQKITKQLLPQSRSKRKMSWQR